MRTVIRSAVAALMLSLASSGASAHSMEPGYVKKYGSGIEDTFYYVIKNDLDFPATFKVNVYEKDGKTLADGWSVNRELFKIVPGNEKRFGIKVNSAVERKLLVCSELYKVGLKNEEPKIITRVCSRLWIRQ